MSLFYYATLIAFTILWEAPHQPALGQELVAHTIVNRSELWGMNIEAVVMQNHQYAGWTHERRELWRDAAAYEVLPWGLDPVGQLDRIPQEGWREATEADWWRIWCMSLAVLMGKPEPQAFEGVTHFDNPRFWEGGDPPWAEGKEELGCVADHCFWR